jgi:hypothetical protein
VAAHLLALLAVLGLELVRVPALERVLWTPRVAQAGVQEVALVVQVRVLVAAVVEAQQGLPGAKPHLVGPTNPQRPGKTQAVEVDTNHSKTPITQKIKSLDLAPYWPLEPAPKTAALWFLPMAFGLVLLRPRVLQVHRSISGCRRDRYLQTELLFLLVVAGSRALLERLLDQVLGLE